MKEEIGETKQERVAQIKARQSEGDDEGFHGCGGEIVADSANAAQFKKGSPADVVDLVSHLRESYKKRRDCGPSFP